MRNPLMFRSTHDAVMAARDAVLIEKDATLADLRAQVSTLRERETQLMDQYVKLATPAPTPVRPVKEPDPIAEAIRRRAGGNAALRSHLSFWAREMREREEPMDPSEIVACILDWSRVPQPLDGIPL